MTDRQRLEAAVGGDLVAFRAVGGWAMERVAIAGAGARFMLTAAAVASVLQAYVAGDVSDSDARAWAEFIRYDGYLGHGRIDLEIEWDEAAEEPIAEALMRLSELGDLVDGKLRSGEGDQLLAALRNVGG